MDPNAVVKEKDHWFLLDGTIPPSFRQLHKHPAIIPRNSKSYQSTQFF